VNKGKKKGRGCLESPGPNMRYGCFMWAAAGEAVDLLKRTDSVVAQAETLVDLAEVLRLAGRRKEADDVLEGAVELFEAKGNVAAVEALRVPAASS
jgi:hypothetical protein